MGRALLEMRGDLRAPLRVEEEAVWMCQARAGGGRATGGTSPRPPQVRTYLPSPHPHGRRDQRCAHCHVHLSSIPDPDLQVYSVILMVLVMIKTLYFDEATMSVEQNHWKEPQTLSKPAVLSFVPLK